jgi:hypothetical protein
LSGRASITILPDPERGAVTSSGPLRSLQEAELAIPAGALEEIWRPELAERLGLAYWRFLNRRSLGLLRVVYGPASLSVVLVNRRLELLRFRAPRYDSGPGFGRVTWPIERGVLVSRRGRGRGYLQIDIQRLGPYEGGARERVRVRASVANYYPLLRGGGWFARIGALLYSQTQVRIHVWVTRGFLRSLADLDLPELRPERRGAYPPAG